MHPFEYILFRKPWRRRVSPYVDITYTPYSHYHRNTDFGTYHYCHHTMNSMDSGDLLHVRKVWANNYRSKTYQRWKFHHE
jgi:hypothetical protein